MPAKNLPSLPIPEPVQTIADAVGARIGRTAWIRQTKNAPEWWVSDPLFSHVQHGARKGPTDYRAGYWCVQDPEDQDGLIVSFRTVHTPVLAKNFRDNVQFQSIRDAIELTAGFRELHYLHFASRRIYRETGKHIMESASDHLAEFLEDVDWVEANVEGGLVGDLFPVIVNNRGAVGNAPKAGNDFWLRLADGKLPLEKDGCEQLVSATWPLFVAFYPREPIEQRDATLARSMRSAGIVEVCEFLQIEGLTAADRGTRCIGALEGAHINAHTFGGSDRAKNGLWLCNFHHQITEGRLIGSRSNGGTSVRLNPLGTHQKRKARRDAGQ